MLQLDVAVRPSKNTMTLSMGKHSSRQEIPEKNQVKIKFEVTNSPLARTVKSFEIYVYAEDVNNKKLYGTSVYHATTMRNVKAEQTVFSDYFTLPDRNKIKYVYCGIHSVTYQDGSSITIPDEQIEYSWGEI